MLQTTQETALWATVSNGFSPPPNCTSLFSCKAPPPTTLLFLLEKRKRRQRERRRRGRSKGVAISFRVPARLIGSWQHMEP